MGDAVGVGLAVCVGVAVGTTVGFSRVGVLPGRPGGAGVKTGTTVGAVTAGCAGVEVGPGVDPEQAITTTASSPAINSRHIASAYYLNSTYRPQRTQTWTL